MCKKCMINLIKKYQSLDKPKRCRFYPSCSNYALECFNEYNFVKASFYTVKRIIRCNPLSKGGYDPIPKIKKLEKEKLKLVTKISFVDYLNKFNYSYKDLKELIKNTDKLVFYNLLDINNLVYQIEYENEIIYISI